MSYEFKSFPKIPRLNKMRWMITEKLDGTNGIVHIVKLESEAWFHVERAIDAGCVTVINDYAVFAGSRTRWLSPRIKGGDNFHFAEWVEEHSRELVELLGEGTHYGEWYGRGIQRGYGLEHRRFALFNPPRYPHLRDHGKDLLCTVPILEQGEGLGNIEVAVEGIAQKLQRIGSAAVADYMNPEGLVLTVDGKNHKVIINECDKENSRDQHTDTRG